MNAFYISIRKDGQIFRGLEKVSINLDTSSNIVKQAHDFVSSSLASMNIIYAEDDYAWKVYRLDGSEYGTVSISKNWVG